MYRFAFRNCMLLFALSLCSMQSACSKQDSPITTKRVKTGPAVATQTAAVQTSTALCDFAIYSKEQTVLRDRVTSWDGYIGSAGSVDVGLDSVVNGDIESVQRVVVQDRGRVNGDVTSGADVMLRSGASISGDIDKYAALSTFEIPTKSVPTGSTDVFVYSGQSRAVSPGTYNSIVAYGGSTLTLTAGTYNVRRFVIESSGVQFRLDISNGEILVNADEELRFGNQISMTLLGGDSKAVHFYTNQWGPISIGTDQVFYGTVTAPFGEIRAFSRMTFNGALYGRRVTVESDIMFYGVGCNDPCAGVTCDSPPDDVCVDTDTLRNYNDTGSCSGGECEYSFTDESCDFGCEAGACKPPECETGACCDNGVIKDAGVVCRASAGDCDVAETCDGSSAECPADGFVSASTECRASAGACDVAEQCDGSSAECPADEFASSSTECRALAGDCDVAEMCDGASAECPVDEFASASMECRASAGDCDVAEQCDGASAECPADGFASASTECRASAGACDIAETCDGTSAECPADEFASSSTECRASAGACDVAEQCDGLSAECPVDEFASASTECRASAGDCDVAEQCDGSSAECPVDGFASSSTECRASAGDCDVAEQCDGSSAECPVDGFASSSTECRASAGDCDVAETCDGASAECPMDGFASSSTECRASAGACDVAEQCDGSSAECPVDEFASSSTECRASAGACDVVETCDGISAECPVDEFASASTECRASAGDCDVAESCDGTSAECPADGFASVSTECRASAGDCDVAETCDGASAECPADGFASASMECRASAGACDVAEQCDGSSAECPVDEFASSSMECRASVGDCDVAETCDGSSAECPTDGFASSSTECRASAGACDVAETCDGSSAVCPSDGFVPASTECRASAGECDVAELCDGLSAECPADVFVSSSTECRESAGACDMAETCDGVSATCPADAFASATTECRASAGDCDVAETCDGTSAACPSDEFVSASTECRSSAGECDVAETCDGASAVCPADGFASASTECRASAGDCDVAETCDGSSAECPSDGFASSSTECRASAGDCDVAETCDGLSAECPSDGFASSSTECRASAGDCDVAEMCDGASAECPVDEFESSSTECRASAGDCDVAETCDGTSAECPVDEFASSSTECRASAGDCDVAETCDGLSAECPSDGFASSSTECRASAGACDVAEQCDGSSAECPVDEFASSSTECRASAGACDVAETCDGASAECPSDVFVSASTECRASTGDCDVAETCDGASAECPVDEFESSSTECRASAGDCDVAETCDGTSAECPVDEFASSSTECRASAGECDVAETCDGISPDCPSDAFASTSTVCRTSAGECDVAETCDGASAECPVDEFASSSMECRASAGECDLAEQCDGVSAECPVDGFASSSMECRASAGECDVAEQCDGVSAECPVDGFASSSTECRAATDECDAAEMCDGSSAMCPSDGVLSVGTECRPSEGSCDISETCDGNTKQCPSDSKSTQECRSATGDCDVAEICDGVSNDCPPDDYVPSSEICDQVAVDVEYGCSGEECGADAQFRELFAYCSGSEPVCNGNNLVWHDWEILSDCSDSSVCVLDVAGSECTNCEYGCENNACIDPCDGVVCDDVPDDYCADDNTRIVYQGSGTCIGGTCEYAFDEIVCEHGCVNSICKACSSGECCGEDGFVLDENTQCSTSPVTAEYRCSSDSCGADAESRGQYRYCNGASSTCGVDNLKWGEWEIVQSCYTYGHCVSDGSSATCENCELGCAEGQCNAELPPDPSTVAPDLDETEYTTMKDSLSFIYTGSDPIQKGMAPETIEEKRIVLLSGSVLNKDDTPLAGVTVTLLHESDYGSTVTRLDGAFDMVTNGGGQYTINFEKDGYLPVQRKLKTGWEEYTTVPTVVMIPTDPIVTALDMTGSVSEIQVAPGTVTSDERGDRQGVLIVPPGTTAQIVMRDGSRQTMEDLDLRITEYTIGENGPETMPGDLPATTIYTYAVEVSSELAKSLNAKTVELSQPVYYYLDNFLDMPTGSVVPNGYYDRDTANWKNHISGLVVEVLDIQGGAAVIDLDGTGVAASQSDLDELNITDDELGIIADRYEIGKTFWRVPMVHFTPFDLNFPPVYVPADAAKPNPEDPYVEYLDQDINCEQPGSTIYCADQSIGESVPLFGSDTSLNYRSRNTAGRLDSLVLKIPVQSDSFCEKNESLLRTEVTVNVMGQETTYTLSPSDLCGPGSDNVISHVWNGKDGVGRYVAPPVMARVKIANIYDQCAGAVEGEGEWVFGGYCGVSGFTCYQLPPDPSQIGSKECGITSKVTTKYAYIGNYDTKRTGLGGWSLANNHFYHPGTRRVYLGSGDVYRASKYKSIIDSEPLLFGSIWNEIAVSPDNKIYIFSYVGYSNPDNLFRQYKTWIYDPDKNSKKEVYYNSQLPQDKLVQLESQGSSIRVSNIQFGPDGNLFCLAESTNKHYNAAVLKMDKERNVTLVGGLGESGDYLSDGIDAKSARIYQPNAMAIDSNGRIYIAEDLTDASHNTGPSRMRMIDTDGKIYTIYETDEFEKFPAKRGLIAGDNGEIFLKSNYGANVALIWRLDPSSNELAHVMGYNNRSLCSYVDDKIPLDDACLLSGSSVYNNLAITKNGYLLVPEHETNPLNGEQEYSRVRKIGEEYFETIVGNGVYRNDGDGSLPLSASIERVLDLDVGPNGDIYLSVDAPSNSTIRRVSAQPTGEDSGTYVIPNEEGSEVYVFANNGRHLKTKDAITNQVLRTFDYNSEGQLISIVDALGRQTVIERDETGRLTGIVPPADDGGTSVDARRITIELDENDYISRVVNPDGSDYQMVSDDGGLLQSFIDPNGNETTFTFDDKGRLLTDEDDVGSVKTLSRTTTETTEHVTFTSGGGITTQYVTEGIGQKERSVEVQFANGTVNRLDISKTDAKTSTFADGTVVTQKVGPDPRWGMRTPVNTETTVTTPSGRTKTMSVERTVTPEDLKDPMAFDTLTETVTQNEISASRTYDAASKQWTYTSAENRQQFSQIDELGRIVKAWSTAMEPVEIFYDTYGRIEEITAGTGAEVRSQSFTYDDRGYIETVTDALGRTTSYINDDAGRVLSKVLPDGTTEIGFGYDAKGNVTSITPPGKPAHSFDYTAVDLLEDYIPPAVTGVVTPSTQYAYNLDRQVDLITRPDGQTIDYVYDTAGRLDRINLPEGEQLTYGYHPQTGKLNSVTAPNGEVLSYTYDGALLTGTTLSGTVMGTVAQSYNNDFRTVTQKVNGDHSISFTYDDDGLLESAGSLDLILDPVTGMLEGTNIGEVTTTNSYTGFGELDAESYVVAGTPLYEVSYTRDKLGRIDTRTEQVDGVSTMYEYAYDINGRLTEVYTNGQTDPIARYDYDDNGNRVSYSDFRAIPAVVQNGNYDDQDRLLSYGDTDNGIADYTYTDNGELLTKTLNGEVTGYTYDVLGNLRTVNLPDGTSIDYIIDGENRRVGKVVNGTLEQGLLYKDALNPIAELDGSGNVVSRFVYGSKFNVPDYFTSNKLDGSTWQTYRIISNHLGSPRMVVNTETGEVVQRIDYDEFGLVLEDTNPGFQPFGFAGGLYDEETGLVRFGARDYDAETGRWCAKDPIGFGGGDTNLYGYVMADPINFIDPNGLDAWDWVKATLRTINPWTGPTNVAGIYYGAIAGKFQGVDSNGNIIFDNTGLGYDRTIGDVVCYASSGQSEKQTNFAHENAHTQQHTVLGPFYGPAHIYSILFSTAFSPDHDYDTWNPLEWGPNQTPSTPWGLP